MLKRIFNNPWVSAVIFALVFCVATITLVEGETTKWAAYMWFISGAWCVLLMADIRIAMGRL